MCKRIVSKISRKAGGPVNKKKLASKKSCRKFRQEAKDWRLEHAS